MRLRDALAEHAPDLLEEWRCWREAQGRPPHADEAATVARFRSRTYPQTSYQVWRGRGGVLGCECPSYQYRRICAHVRAASVVYGGTRNPNRPRSRVKAALKHERGAG